MRARVKTRRGWHTKFIKIIGFGNILLLRMKHERKVIKILSIDV